MSLNSINNPDHNEQNQIILLKAYKRKTKRQERYLLYEKDYRHNHKRIISFDEGVIDIDKSRMLADEKSDINYVLSQRELHKTLLNALDSLSMAERTIIDECFFEDAKRLSYEELGKRHNVSRQVYTRKLQRILRKLRQLIEQNIIEF